MWAAGGAGPVGVASGGTRGPASASVDPRPAPRRRPLGRRQGEAGIGLALGGAGPGGGWPDRLGQKGLRATQVPAGPEPSGYRGEGTHCALGVCFRGDWRGDDA